MKNKFNQYTLSMMIILVSISFVKSQTIQITSLNGTSFCGGDQIDVNYILSGSFVTGNQFSVELSDKVGSFANPFLLGSITSNVDGTISGVIPTTRIRCVCDQVRQRILRLG